MPFSLKGAGWGFKKFLRYSRFYFFNISLVCRCVLSCDVQASEKWILLMVLQKTLKLYNLVFIEHYNTIKNYYFEWIKIALLLLESSWSSFSVLCFCLNRSKDINLRFVTGAGLHICISGLQASVNFKVEGKVSVLQVARMLWFFFCFFSNFTISWLFV